MSRKDIESGHDVKKDGLGWIVTERLEKTRDNVTEALSLKKKVAIGDLYAAGFLPKVPVAAPGAK